MAEVNDFIEIERKITAEMVDKFVEISGDDNLLHTSEQFASRTIFKKRVVHGLITAGLISQGLTKLLGNGNAWVNQNLEFKRPVYINDRLTAKLKIEEKKDKYKIFATIKNQNGKTVLEGLGESVVLPIKNDKS